MFFTSPVSNITTPALVSVAMSRSDSRDSNYSTTSTTSDHFHFNPAPLTVSYSTSPVSYMMRTTSNTSTASFRRASNSLQRRDSTSQWISSPYRSCQQQDYQEPSSYLSDDDLLYIAPTRPSQSRRELPVASIPSQVMHRKELTTEEQIALLRDQQTKEHDSMDALRQQRRQAALQAQKAVRFAEQQQQQQQATGRRPSLRRRGTTARRGVNQLRSPQT